MQITGGGWSNIRSKGIYYQDQDGNHRLKFNISGNITLTGSYTGTIAGVTFVNNTYGQPLASQIGEAGVAARATLSARVDSNAGTFTVISTAGNFNFVTLSGDVELASKPTWA